MQAFLLGWDWKSIVSGVRDVFNVPIFYPEHRTLTYMDHMLGETVTAAPVLLATGSSVAAAYNFLFLLSFVTSAWGTYRLVRLFQVPRSGGILCGLLYAYSSYRFSNLDLLNQLQTQFLPLGLFFAVRYLQRWKLRDLVGLLGVMVAQVYFGWYYTFYLALALGLLALYALGGGPWRSPRAHGPRFLALSTLALLLVLPVTLPYVEQRIATPGFRRSLGEAALYSADLTDYLKVPPSSVLAGALPLPVGPQAYWPGIVAIGLGAIGAGTIVRRGRTPAVARLGASTRGARRELLVLRATIQRMGLGGYFLVCGFSSLILSLGPILQVGGHKTWIPLPYSLLYFAIPGFSGMRAPARFSVLVLLAVVVLAGLGYRHLWERYAKQTSNGWRLLTIGLFCVAGLSAFIRPLPLMKLPRPEATPAAYQWLAAQPAGPLLEFPVPAQDSDENQAHALRQFYTLYHQKPLIDGCSGFVSPAYKAFRLAVQTFPSEAAIAAVDRVGARWILVHYGDYWGAERDSLSSRISLVPRLGPRARFNDDVMYELVGHPQIFR